MDTTTIIGISASIFTGILLLPQLIKIIKKKEADDIFLWMLASLFLGLRFWIYNGCLKKIK